MIRLDCTLVFFDRPAVTDRVDKATRRVLSRFGAFVRRTARKSIRNRKRPSPPGEPPSSHVGLLKRFIFFAFDPAAESVVIGPAQLTQNERGEAPSLLEHGGTAMVKRRGKRKLASYPARPYMGPALEAERPGLPAMWAGSVR